jgi:hypothetical protein
MSKIVLYCSRLIIIAERRFKIMKFNFKKVASVIASAVMITSTVGFASASTYPAPFTSGAAVVYGVAGQATDMAAAISISNDLSGKVTASTGGTVTGATTSGGDSAKIETASAKLHIGTNLTDVKTTKITKSDMPNLLAKKTYRSHDSQSYDYEQEITVMPNLMFTQFSSSDYNGGVPTLGVHIPSTTAVLNYTLTFTTPVQSAVGTESSPKLTDMQNTKITILGKEYTLLNAYNGTTSGTTKFELMAGAATDTVNLNEEKTIAVGDKSYTVKLSFVDSTSAKLLVNGEATDSISKGGTYKLSDGTQIGVKDISYQAFAGGVMSADITLGAQKLTIDNGQTVQLNDKNINGLTGFINKGSVSGSKQTINSIAITWKTDDQVFLTPNKELIFPGLQSVKLAMSNITTPAMETTKVLSDGNTAVQIQTTLKDGDVSFDILNGNGTAFTSLGKSGTGSVALITSSNTNLIFDTDTDAYFVASYGASTAGESYLLDARTSQDSSTNYTTIREKLSGQDAVEKCKVTIGGTCTIGNVVLTANSIDYLGHATNLTIQGTTGYFNRLYTKEGLLVYLPYSAANSVAGIGAINVTSATASNTSFVLQSYEEDKVSTIAAGKNINITIGGWSTDGKVQVSSVASSGFIGDSGIIAGTSLPETSSGSQIRTGYVAGDLGSQVLYDQSPTQDIATIVYHGGETYGNVFVADTGATVTPGSTPGTATGAIAILTDQDAANYQGNLIVVGGSCVNMVALKLLDATATKPLCGADFTTATKVGEGHYIIKTFASPYATGKVAMLVAGYEAAETTLAAKKVLQGVDTTVGVEDIEPTLATV